MIEVSLVPLLRPINILIVLANLYAAEMINPPITIHIEKQTKEKNLAISQNYSQVNYIRIKHPLATKGIGFLTNASYNITFERGAVRASGGTGLDSEVHLSSDKIIIGDPYFGYYCYDEKRKKLSTIAVMDELPTYNKAKNEIKFKSMLSSKMISDFSTIYNYCSFLLTQENERKIIIYDNRSQKIQATIPFSSSRGNIRLINDNTKNFAHINYIPTNANKKTFMHSFNLSGDPLCHFPNYNKHPRMINKGRDIRMMEKTLLYYHNNMLTIKQAYNDTVFRMTRANCLIPAYVINWGSKKIDIETALFGNPAGKLVLETWNENKDFIYMVARENVDTPQNRQLRKVKFNYAYFDKKQKQIYGINYKGYPEEHIILNKVKDGIPIYACRLKSYKDKLYTHYTKSQLKTMMELDDFTKFPIEQQKRITSFYNDMNDFEMLVMIMM